MILVFLVVEKLFTTKGTKGTKNLADDCLMIEKGLWTIRRHNISP